jgi:iron complex outermembrane receptor protein
MKIRTRAGVAWLRLEGKAWRLSAFVVAAALAVSPHAAAQKLDRTIAISLPAMKAGDALDGLAVRCQASIIFSAELVNDVQTNAVEGEYTCRQALEAMLADTGLVGRLTSNGAITISAAHTTTNLEEEFRVRNRKTGLRLLASASASALAAMFTSGANAQEDGETRGGTLDQITVTARRVEENLQDTPVSVAAFTAKSLEKRQINSTKDLDKVTPNLQFADNATLAGNNASSQVFIRGIGQNDPTATVDPGVGLYIDDVYMGQSVGGTIDFRDIAGVQILRGPQGTLFGRNTIGGAVLITTNDPADEFGVSARATYGSDHWVEALAAVDIPLSDTLTSRFTIGAKSQDGYVVRTTDGQDLGDANNYTITGKLKFEPSDNFVAKLKFDYTKADENGSPLVFAASNEAATFQRVASADAGCPGFGGDWTALPSVPLIDDLRCANDFQNEGPFANNGTFPLESSLENWGVSGHLEYDLSERITLKSITAYRELDWIGIRDADNTPLTILHTSYDSSGWQFSQEVQAIYHDDNLDVVLGAFYFEDETDDTVRVELNTPAPGVQGDSDDVIVMNENWALFGNISYHLTDRLSAAFGIRYTNETKGSIPDQFNTAAPDIKYLPVMLYEADFESTTISGNISYRWSDTLMTYVSYSEGFKGGGFNSHFNVPQTQQQIDNFHRFNEEEAQSWEFGFKADMFSETFRLNGAYFMTDYDDLQFIFRVGVAPYLLNAGKASIDGFELEATWAPNRNFIFEGGVGFLDDKIEEVSTDFIALGAVTSVTTDNQLPFTPKWQANIGAGYNFYTGDVVISPRVDFFYQGATFFDAINTPEIAQLNAVKTVDLSVAVEPNDGPWRLQLAVNNVADKVYPISGNSSLGTGSGYAEIAYNRGRQIFATISVNF